MLKKQKREILISSQDKYKQSSIYTNKEKTIDLGLLSKYCKKNK